MEHEEQEGAEDLGFLGVSTCLKSSSSEGLSDHWGAGLCGRITMNERPVLFSTYLA